MSRDNARTPMQWDTSPNAGFTAGTPWLAVNPNHVDINAATQVSDLGSVFAHYRTLVELRHTLPVVAHGDFHMLLPNDEQVYAFTRRLDDVELLVLANFGDEDVVADVPSPEHWVDAELLICNYPYAVTEPGTPPSLRPWEACVYRRSPR
jgi:oligo-1,6-glucosidase